MCALVNPPVTAAEAPALLNTLLYLRRDIVRNAERRLARFFPLIEPAAIPPGAWNLAHYLSLRCIDLRPIQAQLARLGLSSLGRTEAHVLASLNQVIRLLGHLTERPLGHLDDSYSIEFDSGVAALQRHTEQLFGPAPTQRAVRIMVTLPSEAADDPELVRALLNAGMDCARINCAHDEISAWTRMLQHLRNAETSSGRHCRVLMDLAGHKIRTGPLALQPAVLRVKPVRNLHGQVIEPATILLSPIGCTHLPDPHPGAHVYQLMCDAALLSHARQGDRLGFVDTRGKARHFSLSKALGEGMWLAHCAQSAYLDPTTRLSLLRGTSHIWQTIVEHGQLGPLPRQPVTIRLRKGDALRLTREPVPGMPAQLDSIGQIIRPANISCTEPAIIDRLQTGQPVWIDDGKLGGEVESVDAEGALLRIRHVPPQGRRLQADRGLNFPETELALPALSAADLAALDFVVQHADMVGFSFVESAADMTFLLDELARRKAGNLAVIAKIETRRAVVNLSDIILGTLGRHRLGIMIARGDLAVELGGERLAEIQEEILWLAEAAHVPVIWATQVLETLTKKGALSRPELTDAAMSGRAECVMLNKGPYILEAVRTLGDILQRMQAHQHKKTAQLRALRIAGDPSSVRLDTVS